MLFLSPHKALQGDFLLVDLFGRGCWCGDRGVPGTAALPREAVLWYQPRGPKAQGASPLQCY